MAFYSATLLGVEPLPVEIEIDLSPGLPFFQIVGLPDAVLKESKTRVKSAILQAGFDFPYDRRAVLNLAPSKIRKEGSGFELGLAATLLAASGQMACPEGNTLFLGELALDGKVKPVPELEALAYAAQGKSLLVVPNESLGALSQSPCPVIGVSHLRDLIEEKWWQNARPAFKPGPPRSLNETKFDDLEFSPFWAKHLAVAAAGGHHYLVCGRPGCGKTFFAESLRVLLRSLEREPGDDVRVLDALFGRPPGDVPWASPHHSSTAIGLIGGGQPVKPGAVTRAHGGILFLDELLEFSGHVLDALREPVEKGFVETHRAGAHSRFPARVQLIAATNPCRCGHWKNSYQSCRCLEHSRLQYQARMSGPFFDRFDVKVLCPSIPEAEAKVPGKRIRQKVQRALALGPRFSEEAAPDRVGSGNFRGRAKAAKLARTLALLDGCARAGAAHWDEAWALQRHLESQGFGGPTSVKHL